MNYFSSKSSAERYTLGRPHFHANTIDHIREFLAIKEKLPDVLDIACGTGLSSKALLAIAEKVHGTDVSEEMLRNAIEKDKINYSTAQAEKQPFANEEFDLITVSSGVHWFDIDAFLTEAHRLLKPAGCLVIYENFFPGDMDDHENFKQWISDVYLRRFPAPPRNKNYDWTDEHIRSKNFAITSPENFTNPIKFNREQLIRYLTTQSNIIAAVESEAGTYTFLEIELWLNKQLSAFFEQEDTIRTVHYGNWIKYLQKI